MELSRPASNTRLAARVMSSWQIGEGSADRSAVGVLGARGLEPVPVVGDTVKRGCGGRVGGCRAGSIRGLRRSHRLARRGRLWSLLARQRPPSIFCSSLLRASRGADVADLDHGPYFPPDNQPAGAVRGIYRHPPHLRRSLQLLLDDEAAV